MPNMEAMIVDEQGNEVETGKDGEVWMRGPNVFKGYLNNEEATRNSITKDGWFKSGDVGHVTSEGYLSYHPQLTLRMFYITDRVKELIKFKGISRKVRLTIGFQVPPASLEGLLASHPKVRDVAVIGIYSQSIASEVPRAYVVPGSPPSDELAKELVQFVYERVAQHKRLRGGVKFIDEIPKSASGKILRRVLKELAKKDTSDPMEGEQDKAKL
jgi:4-coumarate--CoA ligase